MEFIKEIWKLYDESRILKLIIELNKCEKICQKKNHYLHKHYIETKKSLEKLYKTFQRTEKIAEENIENIAEKIKKLNAEIKNELLIFELVVELSKYEEICQKIHSPPINYVKIKNSLNTLQKNFQEDPSKVTEQCIQNISERIKGIRDLVKHSPLQESLATQESPATQESLATQNRIQENLTIALNKLCNHDFSKYSDDENARIIALFTRDNYNLLHVAIYKNTFSPRTLHKFIEKFKNYNLEKKTHIQTKEGILHYAVKLDNADTFQEITAKYNSLVNMPDHNLSNDQEYQSSILYYAAKIGSINIVKYLLEQPKYQKIVRQDLAINNHNNALDIAIQHGHSEIVKSILNTCLTKPIFQDHISINTTSIYIAATMGYQYILRLVAQYAQKIDLETKKNPLVLSLIATIHRKNYVLEKETFEDAVNDCNIEVIKIIAPLFCKRYKRTQYFNPDYQNLHSKFRTLYPRTAEGQNILHFAVLNGKLEMAEALIKYAPDLISIQDNFGNTPLHYCRGLRLSKNINQKKLLTVVKNFCTHTRLILDTEKNIAKKYLSFFRSDYQMIHAICSGIITGGIPEKEPERPEKRKEHLKKFQDLKNISESLYKKKSFLKSLFSINTTIPILGTLFCFTVPTGIYLTTTKICQSQKTSCYIFLSSLIMNVIVTLLIVSVLNSASRSLDTKLYTSLINDLASIQDHSPSTKMEKVMTTKTIATSFSHCK